MRLWSWKMSAYPAVLLLKREDFSHYNCQQLREVGCTAREIIDRGFTPKELKKAGFTVRELRLEGFSFAMLQEADFSFHELKEGGFKALTTTDGFSLRLKEAGFTTRFLRLVKVSSLQSCAWIMASLTGSGKMQVGQVGQRQI